jgi:hypothetical protein
MNGDFFQNMAPNAKRSFFATVIFSALAVIIYLFCVQPSTAELEKTKRELSELQDRQYRTDVDLKRSGTVSKDLADLETALKPYRDAMLVPLLESYAMRAKSIPVPPWVEERIYF